MYTCILVTEATAGAREGNLILVEPAPTNGAGMNREVETETRAHKAHKVHWSGQPELLFGRRTCWVVQAKRTRLFDSGCTG